MRIFKKILAWACCFVLLLSCCACGEYIYAVQPPTSGGGNSGGDSTVITPPSLNDDPSDDFTVTVFADGQPYSPRMDMNVYWRDINGSKLYAAPLDKQGVARIDGLDGDFQVSLSAVPNEYSYDPNAYIATNYDKNITLELYTLNRLTGGGTGIYDCYKFSKTGVYSAVIDSPSDTIYFEYAPDRSGTYSIESWVNVAEDNVNPYVDVYGGSMAYKYYIETKNDGGAVGSYTINFLHTVEIADENISTGGGQAVYTFAIKADTKNNRYPVTITFAVKRNGDFDLWEDGINKAKTIAIPKFDFSDYDVADHTYGSGYKIAYPEVAHPTDSSLVIFDDDLFKIWEKSDGGDGFYHFYDEEKYASTGGWGPTLYARITKACRFVDTSFNTIEYAGGSKGEGAETRNNALTVGGVNYKHFIEGYEYLSTYGNINGGSYYCASECSCHSTANKLDWACTAECTQCHVNCRRIPAELVGKKGYSEYANSDGNVPVTAELKEFLAAYCDSAKYFYDGQGWVDATTWNGKNFQAEGGSGWLFACCYYEKL